MAEIHVAACGPKGDETPGRGGWAACALYLTPFDRRPHTTTISQGYAKTTLERMRVMGVVCALEALRGPSEVNLWVDEATNRALTRGRDDIDADLRERLDRQLRSHRVDLALEVGNYELATSTRDAAREAAEAPEEELEDDLVEAGPVDGRTLDRIAGFLGSRATEVVANRLERDEGDETSPDYEAIDRGGRRIAYIRENAKGRLACLVSCEFEHLAHDEERDTYVLRDGTLEGMAWPTCEFETLAIGAPEHKASCTGLCRSVLATIGPKDACGYATTVAGPARTRAGKTSLADAMLAMLEAYDKEFA